MERLPVTRKLLAREIVLDAAKRPLNVGVGIALIAAAVAFDAIWLLPVAVVVYLAMLVATSLDGDRAERVGERTYARRRRATPTVSVRQLEPEIAARVELALSAETKIRRALQQDHVASEVDVEVDRLVSAVDDLAKHANVLQVYLRENNAEDVLARVERLRSARTGDAAADHANAQAIAALEDQLSARAQIERQLARFDAQIEHIAATLGTIHAQLVRMSAEEQAGDQARVAEQVRGLRREIGAAADAMQEAFDSRAR
jgi:hypothetical protein